MLDQDAPAFHADAELHRLLQSSHPENVRLAIVLAQNPALRIQDLSQLVVVALFHEDLEIRALAIEALEAQGLAQVRAVIRTHWQVTHPNGSPAVLYAALKAMEAALSLPKGSLQAHLAAQLQVWPSNVAHRFPSAFLAWCRSQMDGGTLSLPDSLPVLPKALLQLDGLHRLTLVGKRLRQLPDWLGELQGLAYFALESSGIQQLPESLSRWRDVEELRLDCPRLRRFPTMLAAAPRLQTLSLAGMEDIALQGMAALTQVEDLQISHSYGLRRLPADIGDMQRLRCVEIRQTGLTALPDSMAALGGLQELMVMGSALTRMPDWLPRLSSLARLELEFVDGEALPPLVGLDQLEALTLVCPSLAHWPADWCQLPSMDSLTVRGSLAELPAAFAALDRLSFLDLNHHPLQTFPTALHGMTQLRVLHLTHTGITALPDALRGFTSLRHLSLAHNGMTSLPPVLFELPGLTHLDLRNNHLPLPEVLALRAALPGTEIRMA